MSSRTVLTYPDPALRTPAQPLRDFAAPDLVRLAEDMVDTMRSHNGIGLAGPQIGVGFRIAVIEVEDGPLVLINPTLHKVSRTKEEGEEGCLSIPGVYGIVPRARSLVLKAKDVHGKPYSIKAEGLFARVIQHEVDHLDGTLFVDRASELTKGDALAERLGITLPHAAT